MSGELDCPSCGFPVSPGEDSECPKCGERIRGAVLQGLLEVDVAHSGEGWDTAREKIIAAIDHGIRNGHKGVKIIHGYGSTTGHSRLCGPAVALLRGFANKGYGRVAPDRHNPGAHILWLDR